MSYAVNWIFTSDNGKDKEEFSFFLNYQFKSISYLNSVYFINPDETEVVVTRSLFCGLALRWENATAVTTGQLVYWLI